MPPATDAPSAVRVAPLPARRRPASPRPAPPSAVGVDASPAGVMTGSARASGPPTTLPGPARLARQLWNLSAVVALAAGLFLLTVPAVGTGWTLLLGVAAASVPGFRLAARLLAVDWDFSMVRLTDEEIARDLDW